MSQMERDLLDAKPERGSMTGDPLVQVPSNKKKGVKQKRSVEPARVR